MKIGRRDSPKYIIIMTLNVNRPLACGGTDPKEALNKSEIFITTAGYKNTFSYEKLIEFLCRAVARPKNTIVLGGSWKTPVVEGLLDKDFINELRMDGTYNEASFEREYESVWTGDVESAFFESERFERLRKIQLPEYQYSDKISKNGYYILGIDIGHYDDQTEVCVLKVAPLASGYTRKQLVNIYTINGGNAILQAINIKRIFNKFKCRAMVVDGNGPGEMLIDILTTDQEDPDTGEMLWGLGVINDVQMEDGNWRYKKTYSDNVIKDCVYVMKANVSLNSEMYSYCKSQMGMGRIHFLIDENTAKNKLMSQAQGQKMSQAKRAEYLMPFTQTTILRDQLLNLIEENEGAHVILKQANRKIKKDKVSALVYGLYYCKMEEDRRGNKKKFDPSELMMFTGKIKY